MTPNTQIVLVGDSGTAYVSSTAEGNRAIDVTTWTPKWATDQDGTFMFAVGMRGSPTFPRGAVLRSAQGIFTFVDETGSAGATINLGIQEPVFSVHGWLGVSTAGGISAVSWTAFDDVTAFGQQGNPERQRALRREFYQNYNAVEIATPAQPSEVFRNFVQTFMGANVGGVASIELPLPDRAFTAVGQVGTFTLMNPIEAFGQAPFSVEVVRIEPADFLVVVKTLPNHPLYGWRYWRVVPTGPGRLRVETGAIDKPAPGNGVGSWLTYLGKFWTSKWLGRQTQMWQQYMTAVRDALVNNGGTVVDDSLINGRWEQHWDYVRTNICGIEPIALEICQ